MQIIIIGNVDYNSTRDGLILLRGYYFSFNSSKIIDEYKYKNKTYLRILASLNNNKFSIKMQDYLYYYDKIDTKIMIEYSTGKIQMIDLESYKYENDSSSSRELKKCDITISNEGNASSSHKTKVRAIIIIILTCILTIFIIIYVKHFKNK